jgi:transposase
MSKKVQRQYSAELKASAVKMVLDELKSVTQVSQDLHIPMQTLHSWVTKGRKGELSGISTYSPDLVALQTEVCQLKKQLAAAEMEREILKKAAAYFARDTLPSTRS